MLSFKSLSEVYYSIYSEIRSCNAVANGDPNNLNSNSIVEYREGTPTLGASC